jgi:hypothetical protein
VSDLERDLAESRRAAGGREEEVRTLRMSVEALSRAREPPRAPPPPAAAPPRAPPRSPCAPRSVALLAEEPARRSRFEWADAASDEDVAVPPPPDPPPRGVASEGDSTTTTTTPPPPPPPPRIEDAIAAAAAAAAAATIAMIAAPKKTSWASVARRGTDDARADDDGGAFERTENDEENQKVEVEEKETFGVAEEETFGDAEEEIRCDINIPNVPSAFVAKYLPRDVDLDATEEAREGDGVVTRRVAAAKKLGELVADVGVGRVGKGAYSLHWSPCDRVRAAHADP